MSRILNWLVPPTFYCFMVLFVTLTIYTVMVEFIDAVSSQGILIQ